MACDPRLLVRYSHQREVYWRPLIEVDLGRTAPPSNVDVVIAPWSTEDPALDRDGAAHGWRFVIGHPKRTWALWRCA